MLENLNQIRKIYFIGIGGISMSGIAGLAKELGFTVGGSNSDKIYPPTAGVLKKQRIAANSKNYSLIGSNLVVLGGGESKDHQEIKQALRLNIPIISFPRLLYLLTKVKQRIVVCGTHGKTTTSSLLVKMLRAGKLDPGFSIGGVVRDFKTNFYYSASDYFVIEGDEYYASALEKKAKFLYYKPTTLIITNIEMDHFDFYRNLGNLIDKFQKLINTIPPNGTIVACADDLNVRKLLKDCQRPVIWYGIRNKQARFRAKNIKLNRQGTTFRVKDEKYNETADFTFNLVGRHNVLNALAGIACAKFFGCSFTQIKPALKSFLGPKRRFELIAQKKGITIIDDYAHHATAARETLTAARQKYPKSRVWAVFEPHTFSRTKGTLTQLGQAFKNADFTIIPNIYPAREKHPKKTIHARNVVAEIKNNDTWAIYIPTREKVLKYLLKNIRRNDVIVIMAVGNFNVIARELAEKI